MLNIKKTKDQDSHYLVSYNNIIAKVAEDYKKNFSAIASPTLSRQETVTFLYQGITTDKVTSNIISSTIIFPVRVAWHFFNLIFLSLFFQVPKLPSSFLYIRSWLVPQSFKGSLVKDDYFREMTSDLSKVRQVVTGFHPLGYRLAWKLKGKEMPENSFLQIALLNPLDVLIIFIEYFYSGRLKIEKSYFFDNKNITKAINQSLLKDFIEFRSFLSFVERKISKKLIKKGINSYLYIFENQSWEKASCSIYQEKKINCIGYQSSGFSKLFLNFFPTEIDFSHQIQPDTILTVGDGFRDFLIKNSFYRSEILSFFALRFNHQTKDNKYLITRAPFNYKYRFLYAFSVHISQYKLIFKKLTEYFSDSDIEVYLKLHPLHSNKKDNFIGSIPKNFHFIDHEDMTVVAEKYDFVLFNDNSFGIESLIYGVKSFELDLFGNDLDERLISFNVWPNRINDNFLSHLSDCYKDSSLENFNEEKVYNYINYIYKPYKKDLDNLRSIFKR